MANSLTKLLHSHYSGKLARARFKRNLSKVHFWAFGAKWQCNILKPTNPSFKTALIPRKSALISSESALIACVLHSMLVKLLHKHNLKKANKAWMKILRWIWVVYMLHVVRHSGASALTSLLGWHSAIQRFSAQNMHSPISPLRVYQFYCAWKKSLNSNLASFVFLRADHNSYYCYEALNSESTSINFHWNNFFPYDFLTIAFLAVFKWESTMITHFR